MENAKNKGQSTSKSLESGVLESSESENKRVILTNDSIINNENNILIQKNTNEADRFLGKKLAKPFPISMTELMNLHSENENAIRTNCGNKESKTNLRTFELLRTNTSISTQSIVAININNNVMVSDNIEIKSGKKEDIKKWISRI